MASYHRVLKVHGRSVQDKNVECDYDIHPWDVLINGKRWAGKIRLVGFVDAFYLICYTGQSKFEHGIVVYKDDEVIRKTLEATNVNPATIKLDVVNKTKVEAKGSNEPPKYFKFENEGGHSYKITSLGHPIDLRTNYPKSDLGKYEIKIHKGRDRPMRKRIKRGVTQHDLLDLIHDVVRLGFITHAELTGYFIGKVFGGTIAEDVLYKYVDGVVGVSGSRNLALSGEKA